MKGLELSKSYFAHIREQLCCECRGLEERAAFALLGQGSECFGLDDEYSQDHDFEPRFFIVVDAEEFTADQGLRTKLHDAYCNLPNSYRSYLRQAPEQHHLTMRGGVVTLQELSLMYLGMSDYPRCSRQWMSIPDDHPAHLLNGEVFLDHPGKLSELRKKLEGYYPKQVTLKKLSANLARCARAGQYNLPRAIRRQDWVAASFARQEFMEAYYAALFLIVGIYRPHHKLMHRYLQQTKRYPCDLLKDLEVLAVLPFDEDLCQLTEQLCAYLRSCVEHKYSLSSSDSFLQELAQLMQAQITDPYLKSLHILRRCICDEG